MQLVRGRIVEVLEATPEKKIGKRVIKAREERVLIVLPDGTEGYLFKKDTAISKEEDELFDLFIEGDDIDVVIKKIFPDGGKFIFSTILTEKRNELAEFEKKVKERPLLTVQIQKLVGTFGYLAKYEDFTCLLPLQLMTNPEVDPQTFVGQTIDVVPIRLDYSRFRVIVSQLHAENKKARVAKKQFVNNLSVGLELEGVVKNIESYGAFVEIFPDVEGLLHISEVDHKRINSLNKFFSVGDKVKVKIIKLDKDHIALSRKATMPNYYGDYFSVNKVNDIVDFEVLEVSKPGLKVSLSEGVEAFVPRSEFSWDRDADLEIVKPGDKFKGKIIEADKIKRRFILSVKQTKENPWEKIRVYEGDIVEIKIAKVLEDGFKVDYFGISGYMSKGTVKSRDPNSIKEDDIIKVKIRIFDANKQRFVVSMRDAEERQDRDTYNKFMKSQEKISSTLGDYFTGNNKKNKK